MYERLDPAFFTEHRADDFPVEQVIDFVGERDLGYGSWAMDCDYCDYKTIQDYREEITFYNKEKGFYLSDKDMDEVEDECVDFAVYFCPKCGKWFTYIE